MLRLFRTYRRFAATLAVLLAVGTVLPLVQHACAMEAGAQLRCCCEDGHPGPMAPPDDHCDEPALAPQATDAPMHHGPMHDHEAPMHHGPMHDHEAPTHPVNAMDHGDCCRAEMQAADDEARLPKATRVLFATGLFLPSVTATAPLRALPVGLLARDTGPPPPEAIPLHLLHAVLLI